MNVIFLPFKVHLITWNLSKLLNNQQILVFLGKRRHDNGLIDRVLSREFMCMIPEIAEGYHPFRDQTNCGPLSFSLVSDMKELR